MLATLDIHLSLLGNTFVELTGIYYTFSGGLTVEGNLGKDVLFVERMLIIKVFGFENYSDKGTQLVFLRHGLEKDRCIGAVLYCQW